MTDEKKTTYSTLGPWSGAAPAATVAVEADMAPVIAVLERIEAAVKEPPPPPRFHVPVPLVTVEAPAAPIVHVEAPKVEVKIPPLDQPRIIVNLPEPVVNITVPEPTVRSVTVEPQKIEVQVMLPGLKALIVANFLVLALATVFGVFVFYEYLSTLWPR